MNLAFRRTDLFTKYRTTVSKETKMGNRHVSIYCSRDSNQVLILVNMWRNLNYEIMIDTLILYHCDRS